MKHYSYHRSFYNHVNDVVQKHGLSPELMQEMVRIHQTHSEHRRARDMDLVRRWAEGARSDSELCAGEGFDSNVARACDVVRRFGDADLRKTLDKTGMSNNPALIRFLVRVGRELQKVPPPKPPISKEEAAMQALYPTMSEN
jgi:hypothetical protein